MLHSAVIEVRQHLCCANVFLKFKESLNHTESLKINVDEIKIQLQNPQTNADIFVNKYFLILAGTLSNLIVDTENAAFRISIKDVEICQENDGKDIGYKESINLTEQQESCVKCNNCEFMLVKQQKYKIREFPSGAIDVSEFFCHHGPNFKDVLVPSLKDLYYGFQFIVLNMDILGKSIRSKEEHLYCKRCLKYLGETMFNGRAAKLWTDSVKFSINGEKLIEIFVPDGKSQIHKLLLKAIDETSLPSPEPLLRNMHFTKVLMEATFPNRQSQYLLLHILEKHLPVLRYTTKNAENVTDCVRIVLQRNKAFKILYRIIAKDEDNTDDDNDNVFSNSPPLLEYWLQNINILKLKISPLLFKTLCDELNTNIEILPEIYRVNNDDFLLSYIFY